MTFLQSKVLVMLCACVALIAGGIIDSAIIGAGNSGVGKSFLLNLLLDSEEFDHRFSADSVTDKCEFVTTTLLIGQEEKTVSIFNIPGLIEIDEDNLKRNKAAMEMAFKSSDKQVILFVLGNEGGRPRAEDIQAFLALQKAFRVDSAAVLFVFNKKPASFTSVDENRFIALVKQALKWPGNLNGVFIDHMAEGLKSALAKQNRESLLLAIQQLSLVHHSKKEDIVFNVDEIRMLDGKIKDTVAQMEKDKALHDRKMKESEAQQNYWRNQAAQARAKRSGWGFSIGIGPFSMKVEL